MARKHYANVIQKLVSQTESGRKFPTCLNETRTRMVRCPFRESYAYCTRANNVCTLGWISDRKFVSLLFSAGIFGTAPAREILGDFGGGVTKLRLTSSGKFDTVARSSESAVDDQGKLPEANSKGNQALRDMPSIICVSIRVANRLNRIFPKVILPK